MFVRTDPINLEVGQQLGFLGLEMHTRRRNRTNGTVLESDGRHLLVHVDQSFGNCPKYIQVGESLGCRLYDVGFRVYYALRRRSACCMPSSLETQLICMSKPALEEGGETFNGGKGAVPSLTSPFLHHRRGR